MPSDEKGVFNNTVVVELLAESGSAALRLRPPIDEELDDCLQHVLLTIGLFLANQGREDRLESVPVLRDVPVRSKDTDQADVEFIFACDVQLELLLTDFTEDVISADGTFSFLLGDKSRELFASGH